MVVSSPRKRFAAYLLSPAFLAPDIMGMVLGMVTMYWLFCCKGYTCNNRGSFYVMGIILIHHQR
ncbi:hypothetical protein BP00DRAFT_457038 [Aspergillus indologenus CBS 114.80]|uniref:Uncharacterized protein n=1 Tax=Aspergillus indologenus CBS 114.80 TaxID=1450541 RepID=A0A2V5I8I5_9EURO|nr:hypothetical protein BP00DRAFT_457038 [Aspergillus indologenus CBS 114.80]